MKFGPWKKKSEEALAKIFLSSMGVHQNIFDLIGGLRMDKGWERRDNNDRRLPPTPREMADCMDALVNDDDFLLLFERPINAVRYALSYHQTLAKLSEELDISLVSRVGIHLGEVILRVNKPEDVARGYCQLAAC